MTSPQNNPPGELAITEVVRIGNHAASPTAVVNENSLAELRQYLCEAFWEIGIQAEIGEKTTVLADDVMTEIATQRLVNAARRIHSTVRQLQALKSLLRNGGGH